MRHEGDAAGARLPSIDILRGIAIAWVVLFHIWGDLEYFPGAPYLYYDDFVERVRDGSAWPAFTAFTDLVFRLGFQGVPLFMTISGISLTIAAYRAGGAPSWPRFLVQRLRKLMLPYWAGVALTYGVMAAIAWRQTAIGDVSFGDAFTGGVTISRASVINVDWGVAFASVALIPRLIEKEWFFAPQLALWFVGLIAQYYLLFPLLFVLMRRIGVVAFLVLTFGVTVAANWWVLREYTYLELQFEMVTGWAPFRLIEFTAGMGIGWLLVAPEEERARALAFARHPLTVIALLAGGLTLHTTGGLLIGRWGAGYWQSLALPLSTVGLAMLALPMLVRRPGWFEAIAPVRLLIGIGVMSYTVLIVSDAMRLVASQLRVEDVADGLWWTFLVAMYVPVTMLIAWPMAWALGLLPKRRRPTGKSVPATAETWQPERDEALAPAGAR